MLDLGYDGQHLIYDKIKQTLRIDWADLLPAEQNTDDGSQCLNKLMALILSIIELEKEVDKGLSEVIPAGRHFKCHWR